MKRLLAGARIDPRAVTATTTVRELVDGALLAYNGARLREAAQLFVRRMLEDDVTVGVSLSGALTPAGLGMSCLIPLVEAGFVDWIVSTGANLYHDTHFGPGLPPLAGRQLDRHERRRPRHRGLQAQDRRVARRERARRDRPRRQARGRQERRAHPRRRLAQELRPADRAAGAGGARDRGEGARLLRAVHR